MTRFADFVVAGPGSPAFSPRERMGVWREIPPTSDKNAWTAFAAADEVQCADSALITQVAAFGWRAWVVGELSGYATLQGATTATVLRKFLHDVAESSERAAELNGHFLIFGWSERRSEWHVWTSRLGSLHGYYLVGNRLAIGTFFPAVAELGSHRKLDWEALTSFFALGYFPGDTTYFTDVRLFRPASHYVFAETGALVRHLRYWTWHHTPNTSRSYSDTVDEFAAILHAVMADQTRRGRIAMPISGGLDSRTVFAATSISAPDRARQMWCYSYGYSPDSIEISIADRVAAAGGLACEKFTIAPYLFERLPVATQSLEGFYDITQPRQLAVADEISANADYVIAAHWGDVWLDDMGVHHQAKLTPSSDELANLALGKMSKGGAAWLLEHVSGPQTAVGAATALPLRAIDSELSSLAHIHDPDFRLKAYKTEQWCLRWTAVGLRAYQTAAFPRLPFFDTRLIDFFCTVPTRSVRGRRLQIDYLKRFAPCLARVEWQPYRANLYWARYHNSLLWPKRLVAGARRRLLREHVTARNSEVQFLGAEAGSGLAHWLTRPGLRLHDIVPKERVQSLVDAYRASPFAEKRAYTVSMLLTFSSWLEHHG